MDYTISSTPSMPFLKVLFEISFVKKWTVSKKGLALKKHWLSFLQFGQVQVVVEYPEVVGFAFEDFLILVVPF